MNEFPDILGMELHDAAALLEAEGLAFIITETKPAKKELSEGVLRVIKIQYQDTQLNQAMSNQEESKVTIVLTVCRI